MVMWLSGYAALLHYAWWSPVRLRQEPLYLQASLIVVSTCTIDAPRRIKIGIIHGEATTRAHLTSGRVVLNIITMKRKWPQFIY
ncbi:hypothetical protein B0H11DRAFT_2102861 [Mycena galericulata]|nr:hypothetical protein B0H11DRAFT_2102861 [Mycena galericulata]